MRLRDVKKDMRFSESCMGFTVVLQALEAPREVDDTDSCRTGLECRCRVMRGAGAASTGDTLMLFEKHNPGAYGLHLEEDPQ